MNVHEDLSRLNMLHLTLSATIQILLSDISIFSCSISWENLFKDQSKFPLVIILLILTAFFLDKVLILQGEV